jgi:hypothetical protein
MKSAGEERWHDDAEYPRRIGAGMKVAGYSAA